MASEYPANAGDPMAINTEMILSKRSKSHGMSMFQHLALVYMVITCEPLKDDIPVAPNGSWNIRAT